MFDKAIGLNSKNAEYYNNKGIHKKLNKKGLALFKIQKYEDSIYMFD